ncbi:hypothetical protein KY346_02500 [Candidatus Woesearchaeota archaeon]|nr:hypothetical protein [Candidatus Woesearchaeota archaeon]
MEQKAPVFVKIEDYKDITEIMALIKEKLDQARFLLSKINEIKKQEDSEIENWTKELEEVTRRIYEIDQALLKPEL